MNKRILGIKLKNIIIFLLIMLIIIAVSVNINRGIISKAPIPKYLTGDWTGQSKITSQINEGDQPGEYIQEIVTVKITISADGDVKGTIGDAELTNCTAKQNRTAFERLINIRTDYIITGELKNGIVDTDSEIIRKISIPFNVSGEEMKGSVFELHGWEYPDPLLSRMILTFQEQ